MKRLLLFVVLCSACSTEQQRTTFPVEISAKAPIAPNEHGWTIRLDSAHASVGPVRFFPGEVLLTQRLQRWMWLPFGGVAQAHPGHYVPGEALGEVLGARTIDLLAATPTLLGEADAVTGDYGSLELSLLVPTSGSDSGNLLAGHSLRLVGSAEKTGQTVAFEGFLDLAKPIEGIRSEAVVEASPIRAHLEIQLATWLSRVDFSVLPAGQTPAPFPEASQPQNALLRGATDTSAYVVTWTK